MTMIWTCGACGGVMSHDPDCAFVVPEEATNDYHALVVVLAWLMGWAFFLVVIWAALGAGRLGAD